MDKNVFKIISETCLMHRDTGESSTFTEARRIMQALDTAGYDIVANALKTSTESGDFYCYDENVQIAQETGEPIVKCKVQCEKCK